MDDLFCIANEVKTILEELPATRNSDDLLYLAVIRKKSTGSAKGHIGCSVDFFFEHRSRSSFPGYESVRRARQKIQADNPELRACNPVEAARAENEKEFRAYALGVNSDG